MVSSIFAEKDSNLPKHMGIISILLTPVLFQNVFCKEKLLWQYLLSIMLNWGERQLFSQESNALMQILDRILTSVKHQGCPELASEGAILTLHMH